MLFRSKPAKAEGGAAGEKVGPRRAVRPPGPAQAAQASVNRYMAAYIMGVANRLANGASNYYRSKFGLGMTEWRTMLAIGTSDHRIVREVAEKADLDYAAASKSLRLLEQRGLVQMEQTSRRGRAALSFATRAPGRHPRSRRPGVRGRRRSPLGVHRAAHPRPRA